MSTNLYTTLHAKIFALEQELRAESDSLLYQVKRLYHLGFTGPQVKLRLVKQGTPRHLAQVAEHLVNLWQS